MKRIYHLNNNDYGQQYFVLASSSEEALELICKSGEYDSERFIGTTVDSLPNNYVFDVKDYGEVVSYETA